MKLTVLCLFAALTASAQSTTQHLPVTDAEKSADALDSEHARRDGERGISRGPGQQHHTGTDMHTSTKRPDWTRERGAIAVHADAWFDRYRFHSGEVLPRVRIHYATLGSPHHNAKGQVANAVLLIHWTGADGDTLLRD
jgi:hypothetical protein